MRDRSDPRGSKSAGNSPLRFTAMRRALCAGAVVAGMFALAPERAAAADAAASADRADVAPENAAPVDLGEIVVQARRRDENIVDAPVAVTVETGQQLKDQDAVLFDDVGREVPNLRMMPSPQSVSAMDVTMRGQTAIRAAIDYDPAVGIYVDGVYVANGQAAMNTLLDIDSVEIVRGAQGTMFGRNNTGGAISFRTNRPVLGVTSSEVAVDAGPDRMFSARGIVNFGLSETVAVRFAYQDNERDGFGSSIGDGQGNFENQNRYQARLGVLVRPEPGFDIYWTYETFHADEVGALLHPLPGTLAEQFGQNINQILQATSLFPGVSPVATPANFYQTDAGYPAHDRTGLDATQLTVTQAITATARAKLILGYRSLHNDTAIDVDATTLPLADTTLANSSGQKSAELQVSDTAASGKWDWVGGLYWFRDDGNAPSLIPPPSAAYQNLFSYLDTLQPGSASFSPYPIVESNTVQNLSDAAFVHGEYHISERWAAAAGLRRTDDTRRLEEVAYAESPIGPACTITGTDPAAPCPPFDKSVSFSYWSWELSTRYRVSDEVNAYFRSGRGQRSGGWNVPVNTLQDQPFRPEQITDYELGTKADLLGGAWTINGDVFLGNYDDMQRLLPQVVGNPPTPTTFVINAGRARVSGAELESFLMLSRSWSLHADLGWTDAHYREFQYSPGSGQPVQNLAGNEFYQTPKFNAGLGFGYEARVADGTVRVHADYSWQDAIQFNVINDFNNQGAYGTLNARGSYVGAGGAWEVALFGTNLTGREYAITGGSVVEQGSPLPAFSWQIPGAPRMFGAELLLRFGPRT